MKQCASCQSELAENTRFCMKCGTPNPDYRTVAPTGEATLLAPPTGGDEKTEMITGTPTQASLAASRTQIAGPAGTEMIPAAPGTLPPAPAARTEMVPEAALRTSVPGSKDEISKIFETSGVCPNCYAPLKKGGTECEECGYRLTGTYCASCGKPVEDGARFCPNCKTAVPVASATVFTPAPAASTGATGVMSAATVAAVPAAAPLGATIVTPPPATAAGPVMTPTVMVPPPATAAPKKGFPVVLVLAIAFVFLLIAGTGGWAVWKFVIQKPAPDTGGAGGVVEDTTGGSTTTGSTGATTGGFPDTGTSGMTQAPDYIGEATAAYNRGDFARALELVQKHLTDHASDGAAYSFAGKICRELGKIEEAKNYFVTAISYDPNNADIHVELGKLHANSGFSDKAVEQFREALRLAPDHQEALWLLAKEFERLGDKENARRTAEQYVRNFPAGTYRSEADAMLAVRGRTGAGTTRTGTTGGGTVAGDTSGTPGGGTVQPPPPPPPPPPSPYVDIALDGTALSLPGMVATVDVMIGGAARKFGAGANMRLDNIEKGSQQYTVRVTYFNASTNEQESTYSGSGMIDIRYPNQRVVVKRIGDRVILQ